MFYYFISHVILTNFSPDNKFSNIIQTKPNQTVLSMFTNLSEPFIGYLHNIHSNLPLHYPQNQNFDLLPL